MYFVSYARSDEEFVLRLAGDLGRRGTPVWVDQLELLPSDLWDQRIEQALEASRLVVVVLSPASVASYNVQAETNFAFELGKTVLPVLLQKCKIPLRLRLIQHADFTGSYDDGLAEVIASLSKYHPVELQPQQSPAPSAVHISQAQAPRHALATGIPNRNGFTASIVTETDDVIRSMVDAFLRQPKWNGKVQAAPQIEPKRLTAATRRMQIPGSVKVIALIDLTVFGSAAEALLFCEDGIRFLDSSSGRTMLVPYGLLEQCTFSSAAAPLLSKHVGIITVGKPDGSSYTFGQAGGPFDRNALAQFLSELCASVKRV